MKFRLVVSGTALSDAQLAAVARSIVDLGPMYQRPEFSVSFDQDEGRIRYGADPLGDDAIRLGRPETARCGHCGARLTAEQFSEHKCGSPAWPCHALPVEQWCDNRGPGDFMGHTCGPPPEVLKLIEEGAKSARRRRMWPRWFWGPEPLYVVVLLAITFGLAVLVFKLVKRLGI